MSNTKAVLPVRPASIKRAFQIKSACAREPDKFEPVPSRPLFATDQGQTYRLADTPAVRSDMAVVCAFIEQGPEYAAAVMLRMTLLVQMVIDYEGDARKHGLVRGTASDGFEMSEALFAAAADSPCSHKRGFKRRQLFARASAIHTGSQP